MQLELNGVIFQGNQLNVSTVSIDLPSALLNLLKSINGFIGWNGGLHVRGLCETPDWHSLEKMVIGTKALHTLYAEVRSTDIPFAQDAVGDQFILRANHVHVLSAETGEMAIKAESLGSFLESVSKEPLDYLQLHPLQQFMNEGKALQPGELIHAYPPFCTEESVNGVSLKAVPANELIQFHAEFASQLSEDGQQIKIEIID